MSRQPLIYPGETVDDVRRRFAQRVEVSDEGCWIWPSSSGDYGSFRGRMAHRASWELYRGPIPEGLYILHRCDHTGAAFARPSCVNPAHLAPGTPRDNRLDVLRAQRRERAEDLRREPIEIWIPSGASERLVDLAAKRGVPVDVVVDELADRLRGEAPRLLDELVAGVAP